MNESTVGHLILDWASVRFTCTTSCACGVSTSSPSHLKMRSRMAPTPCCATNLAPLPPLTAKMPTSGMVCPPQRTRGRPAHRTGDPELDAYLDGDDEDDDFGGGEHLSIDDLDDLILTQGDAHIVQPGVVVSVVGPTASGKTAVIALAQQLGTEIASADARQVYRSMAIGTAQPTAEERPWKHHLWTSLSQVPSTALVASGRGRSLLSNCSDRGSAILAGGSGMYVKPRCKV